MPASTRSLRWCETVGWLKPTGSVIDVLLSARRVGETGFAYGVDMTDAMLDLARANAAQAGATNVEFLKGTIEDIPLPDESVDVVISNCVINLSVDKPKVITEIFRVLSPGGRIGVSDVVAEDHLSIEARAERGSYVGCIAGALSRQEYLEGLTPPLHHHRPFHTPAALRPPHRRSPDPPADHRVVVDAGDRREGPVPLPREPDCVLTNPVLHPSPGSSICLLPNRIHSRETNGHHRASRPVSRNPNDLRSPMSDTPAASSVRTPSG